MNNVFLTKIILLFSKYYVFILFPFISFIIVTFLTKYLVFILPKFGCVDKPRKEHIHLTIIPTSGGIGIVFAFIFCNLLFLTFNHNAVNNSYFQSENLLRYYIPLILLTICGIYDDRFGMSSLLKLFIQITAASLCWYFGIKFQSILTIKLPALLSYTITVFWIVAFINAFNLIDGLDGLAAGLASVSATCLGFVLIIYGRYTEATITFILSGATLGFLKYNFYPAKIFMGDSGSMAIGFIISTIGIITSSKSATFATVTIPVLAAGIPLFDTFLAIWRRTAKQLFNKIIGFKSESKVMKRDSEHLHHRLLKKEKSQIKVVTILYIFSSIFALMAILIAFLKSTWQFILFFILFLLVISTIKKLAYFELWTSSQVVIEGFKKLKKSAILSIFHPIIDFFFLIIAFLISFNRPNLIENTYSLFYISKDILFFLIPILLILNLSRIYKTVWLRASSDDYFFILEALFIGTTISFIIDLMLNQQFIFVHKFFNIITFYIISSSLIIGERMFLRYLKNSFVKKAFLTSHLNEQSQKVLIYGSGTGCKFYLTLQHVDFNSKPIDIVGIIDDDKLLKNQYTYGLKILGTISDIEMVFKKKNINKIVITSENINNLKEKKLKEFCKKNNIELSKITLSEVIIN